MMMTSGLMWRLSASTRGDLRGGRVALHRGRREHHLHHRAAGAQGVEHILKRGAGGEVTTPITLAVSEQGACVLFK